ncbi:MAG: TolC family outer membrane protein [Alphaproteobacteria bacterium]|nr:TolC family outer membrane protein [Alphaproteobacteria bacterium]
MFDDATNVAPAEAVPPAPVMEPAMVQSTPPAVATSSTKAISNLQQAIAIGVVSNPEYSAVANNRRATDEELTQAKALYLPSIDSRLDGGWERSNNPSTRGDLDGKDTETHSKYDGSLTLTQMLFDGGETHYENERQRHRVRSAAHRVKETAEFVGLDITESYLDVLRQRELLNIARENVAQHDEILRMITDGAEAGRSTDADVEQARARLASANALIANNEESLRIAEAAYRREVGEFPGALEKPLAPTGTLSSNVDDQVKMTLAQSPTLDIREADVNVTEAEWKATHSAFYPQVDLQVNGRKANDLGGVEGNDTSTSALMVMNWNLYRGGGDVARTREAVYRQAQAKDERNNTARQVEDNVRQTWARMISAEERAKQFELQAEANAVIVKAYLDQFNLDRRTLLDVLDAQNEWFVSRSNAISSRYLQTFAVYRLLALKGGLLPNFSVPYPSEVVLNDKK